MGGKERWDAVPAIPIKLDDHSARHEANGEDQLDLLFHNGDIDGGVIGAMNEAMDNLDGTLEGGIF